jgi:hypothetical protein
MALTIHCTNEQTVALDEYLEYVRENVDPRDVDSIAASAPMLKALANDRDLVIDRLNEQVRAQFRNDVVASAQVIFLGATKNFYLRANIWPSASDVAQGRVYQDDFAYNLAHDHNYTFMTVGYAGPGYISEIYEFDPDKVEGYHGEPVEFTFLERTHFRTGMVMLYRANRDMHVQYPPDELSITINLMASTPEVRIRDQYFFDLERSTLMRFPPELDGSRRVSIVEMAGLLGDDETRQLLVDLGRKHPARRTRLTAFESAARLSPPAEEYLWELAARDPEPLVHKAARRRLATLSRG